jgi:hypothetical protein
LTISISFNFRISENKNQLANQKMERQNRIAAALSLSQDDLQILMSAADDTTATDLHSVTVDEISSSFIEHPTAIFTQPPRRPILNIQPALAAPIQTAKQHNGTSRSI